MTRPLGQWLNQKVIFQGYVETWKPLAAEQRIRVLLKNVEARPHLSDIEPVRFDHLWVFGLHSDDMIRRNVRRLARLVGMGPVRTYRRRDGTWDYKVEHQPFLSLIDFLEALDGLNDISPAAIADRIDRIQTAIAAFENQEVVIDFDTPVDVYQQHEYHARQALASYQRYLDGIKASKALAAKQFRGTIKPDPISFKSRPSKGVRGFAKTY